MSQNSSTTRLSMLIVRLLTAIVALFLILCLAFPIGFYGMAMYIEPSLPKTSELKSMPLEMPLQIYTADNKLIAQYGNTFSMPIAFEELPKPLMQAFLAAEDDSFFEHSGISVKGLGRAITQMVSDSDQQTGGSTITQQVAKNYFLSSEQTFERKLTEMFLARKIESDLSKDEIMTLYVNKIYLGQGAYGIKAGARRYYNKELSELSLAEMAMLAGLPKAPSEFNPVVNPNRALERRNWILKRMLTQGYITPADYEEAVNSDINLNMYTRPSYDLEMPDLAELARTALVSTYGDKVMSSGWKVQLTVDSRDQQLAESSINSIKNSVKERQTNSPVLEARSGSLKNFAIVKDALSGRPTYPAKITKVSDTRIELELADGRKARIERPIVRVNKKRVRWQVEEGNIIRIEPTNTKETTWQVLYPHIQGALASINPQNGAVIALAAGINTKHTNFNRATQGYRQPGSTIKPLVYSALMEHRKMTPDSFISGSPDSRGWPKGGAGGPSSLRDSLARSRNTSAVNALKRLGLERAITTMLNMGLDKSHITPSAGLALALGAGEATPLQMATAYATFINGGHRVQPYIIERIYNFNNDTIYQANPLQACAVCFNSELDKLNEKLAKEFEKRQKADEEASQKEAKEKEGETKDKDADSTKDNPEKSTDKKAKEEKSEEASNDSDKPKDIFRLNPKTAPQYAVAEQAPSLLSKKTANNMASMLKSAMAVTGKKALIGGRSDIGGKTGTTNQAKDVWFAGVHPTNSAVVWVGFDTPKPLLGGSAFGGTLAAPVWRNFMAGYLSGKSEEWVEEGDKTKVKSKAKVQTTEDTVNDEAAEAPEAPAAEKPEKAKKAPKAEAPPEVQETPDDAPVEEGVDALPGDEAVEDDEPTDNSTSTE